MKYTTQARIEAYLQRDLTESEKILIDEQIEFFSDFINGETGRNWRNVDEDVADGYILDEEVKLFDGNGKREIYIDDFISISKVELLNSDGSVSTTLSDSDDWINYPLNDSPKESVMLRDYLFPYGPASVQITGVFNSGNVPKAIISVCTALTSKFIGQSQVGAGGFQSESIEGYAYKLKTGTDLDLEMKQLMTTIYKYQKADLI